MFGSVQISEEELVILVIHVTSSWSPNSILDNISRHIGAIVGAWVLRATEVKQMVCSTLNPVRNRETTSIHPLPLAHCLAKSDTTHPPFSQH